MRLIQHWLLLGVASTLAACSASPGGNDAASVPAASLVTLTVASTQVARERDWDGRIEAIEHATLAAQPSLIRRPLVEAAAVVVRFTAVEQQSGQRQAQAALEAARASAAEAQANFRRIEDIHARRLVAKSEFDRAQAASDAAQAQLAAARAALKTADEHVGYTAIRAPYRGVVTARHVEPGETVSPGQPLLSGLSLDRLRLLVALPQSEATRIRSDTRAVVVTDDGRRILATRVTVFPQADAVSSTVGVRLHLPEGEAGLMPGMSAKAVFELGQAQAILIPTTALAVRGEVESVYVIDVDGLIGLRQVRTGRRQDGEVEILAGLTPGEQVAVDAAQALQARRAQRERMAER